MSKVTSQEMTPPPRSFGLPIVFVTSRPSPVLKSFISFAIAWGDHEVRRASLDLAVEERVLEDRDDRRGGSEAELRVGCLVVEADRADDDAEVRLRDFRLHVLDDVAEILAADGKPGEERDVLHAVGDLLLEFLEVHQSSILSGFAVPAIGEFALTGG